MPKHLKLRMILEEYEEGNHRTGREMNLRTDVLAKGLKDLKGRSDVAHVISNWMATASQMFDDIPESYTENHHEAIDKQVVSDEMKTLANAILAGNYKVAEMVTISDMDSLRKKNSTVRGTASFIFNVWKEEKDG
jgi:hypothetical protein